jgi:YD repeat-containing protein
VTLGTQAVSYRVSLQQVNATAKSAIRQFGYTYSSGPGDQVANSTVTSYDGNQPVGYAHYAFSFAGMNETTNDSRNVLVRGLQQRFGVRGEVPREIVLVGDGNGVLGSYTNYYRYDFWGNRIYSHRIINPSSGSFQESFNAYYNNGLPPAFNAFQETFSMNNYTSTDNPWSVDKGYWMVKSGVYNGTETLGAMEDTFAWADLNMSDISIQARVFVGNQVNATTADPNRVGIFVHYPGSGSHKWALVLRTLSGTTVLELLDEQNTWLGDTQPHARYGCAATSGWYTFNLAVQGFGAFATVVRPDGSVCAVYGNFPTSSLVAKATGFGLYSGGYSALFDNVTVTTMISPCVTGFASRCDFFIPNGAPGPNVHGAMAGLREFQNATWNSRVESYFSYYQWGGPYQEFRNNRATSTSVYDVYGNLVQLVDARGNQTSYSYSTVYKSAYLTTVTRTVIPGSTTLTQLYSYNFTIGTMLSSVNPRQFNTTYRYDILGRLKRVDYPNGLGFETCSYNDTRNYVDVTNENGWHTRQIYDGLDRLSTSERFLNGTPYSNQTSTYNWADKISSQTDPMQNSVTFQYDAMGRTTTVLEPNHNNTQTLYNDLASWIRTTDENGVYKCSVFDRLGRLLSVVENASSTCQSGIVTNYYYDETGNLKNVTTSTSQSTSYAYDNLNRLVSTVYPDGTSESYAYDSNGNLLVKYDRKGIQTSYSYDSLNRLTTVTYHDSTVTLDQYSYDNNGNLLQLQSQNATIAYTYDSRNRVLSETHTPSSQASI